MRLIRLTAMVCAVLACAVSQEPIPIPDDTVISLQRGNCEGGCPVYRVVVFANGDVIWQGRARVSRPGVLLSRIQPDAIRTLLKEFQSVDFLRLDNVYGYRGTGCRTMKPDTPMVILSLSLGGVSKTLMHHDGCVGEVSEKLTALENRIDSVVNTAGWIKGKPKGVVAK